MFENKFTSLRKKYIDKYFLFLLVINKTKIQLMNTVQILFKTQWKENFE